MKILLINGSPKVERSNTLHLAKAFCAGIQERTKASIEILPVYKLKIQACLGCFSCWHKTPGQCCLHDDMSDVIDKIIRADIIVWSFPLYYFSLPSQLKALIDRQLPMSLPFMESDSQSGSHPSRYDLSKKRYALISTCGFYTHENNYRAVTAQFDRIYGQDNYSSIYCGQGELFRVPELRNHTQEYLTLVKQAGAEFVTGKIQTNTQAKLASPLLARETYEKLANASWGLTQEKDRKIEAKDEGFIFTSQMAALYNKDSWQDADKVLEFAYTDINKRYQIIMKKDRYEVIQENFSPYTTKIETPLSLWQQISRGEVNPEQAMMEHKYRVLGDLSILMNWDNYFGLKSPASQDQKINIKKKSNMNVLLLPWIVIWVILSINPILGAYIGILTSSLLPLLFFKYKATIFEYISIPLINIVCLLALIRYPIEIIIPLSYLLFGLMWFGSIFTKTPLTAYYSMYDYQGKDPLDNPLFIRTNRIITAYWGLLYLVTPIWTYFLLLSPLKSFSGLINSLLPAILVVFTNIFKDFYPKYYFQKK